MKGAKKLEFLKASPSGSVQVVYQGVYDLLAVKGYRHVVEEDRQKLLKVQPPFYRNAYEVDLSAELKEYFEKEHKEPFTYTKGKRDPETVVVDAAEMLNTIQNHGLSKIFNRLNWVNLPTEEVKELSDTRRAAYYAFKNGVVRVTEEEIILQPYSTYKEQLIPESAVRPREIALVDVSSLEARQKAPGGTNFLDFLTKLCWIEDKDGPFTDAGTRYSINKPKFLYLQQLLGYLLHGYRQRGKTDFYIYFLDDEGGGSGKGLLIEAISQLIEVCSINAMRITDASRQDKDPKNLTEFTRLKVYNDAPRRFPLSVLRNETTDNQELEHKFKDRIILPLNRGWKTAVTANYLPMGSDDAELRRVRPFDLFRFFNRKRGVDQHYGQSFFSDDDWTPEDWNFFYCLLFRCVQQWLKCDFRLQYQDPALQVRKLENYSHDFRQFMYQIVPTKGEPFVELATGELWERYRDSKYSDLSYYRTNNKFGRDVGNYLTDAGYQWSKNKARTHLLIQWHEGVQDQDTPPAPSAPDAPQGKAKEKQDELPF